MKKILSVLLVALFVLSSAAFSETETAVNVTALIGPTGMGLVKMMNDDEAKGDYAFTLAASADGITPGLIKGDVDIAYVPANLASVLYNQTQGGVTALAINTLGVLYIVERGDSVKTVEDLRGRTIYASGKGATPEYALNYLLSSSGIDPEKDVNIVYKSEHAECLTAILTDASSVAMLPQPFVTVAQSKAQDIRVALDMSALWDELQAGNENPSGMVTGVVVARTAFAQEHPEKVKDFLESYASSVSYVNANVDEAAKLIAQYGIVPENVAKLAVPQCNIVCITGEEMKTKLNGYLSVLLAQNPNAVGGKVPDDAFYFGN